MTWSKLIEVATYLVAHEVVMIIGSFVGIWLLFITSTGMVILEQKHLKPAPGLAFKIACENADASWRKFWRLMNQRRYAKALRRGLAAAWQDYRALKRMTPVGRVDLMFVRGGITLAVVLISADPIKLLVLILDYLKA